jgi:CheY-like chemotaxis protein
MFNEKQICLEFIPSPTRLYLNADSARLAQVIGNILHNSSKFTNPGGKTQVTVSKSESNEAIIELSDNGVGINSEILPDLFQPFMQADISLDRNRGGLGLGLAIVKGMVELHNGSVSAYSDGLGKGARFSIRLPLEFDIEMNPEQMQEYEKGFLPRRIMVIDDIPDVAEVLSELLQYLGHQVIVAGNGPEGLRKALENNPEIIICDIGLPGMSGYEVARHIRENDRLKEVFLIALSGYAQKDDQEQAKEAGFDRHLAKPVDLSILEQILKDIP